MDCSGSEQDDYAADVPCNDGNLVSRVKTQVVTMSQNFVPERYIKNKNFQLYSNYKVVVIDKNLTSFTSDVTATNKVNIMPESFFFSWLTTETSRLQLDLVSTDLRPVVNKDDEHFFYGVITMKASMSQSTVTWSRTFFL